MRGFSAEGLAESRARVEVLAADGDAAELGRELFAVADLLGTEPSLRRALTDPSAVPESKQRLAQTILDNRVGPLTVDAVSFAAGNRWSSGGDLVDAIEHLGVLALAIAAEKAGRLTDLEEELFRFGRAVSGDPSLRDAITNKQISVEARRGLVSGLLEGRALEPTVALAVHAVASRHRSFEVALAEYQKVVAERQERLVAVIRSAIELTDEQRDRLGAALTRQYGRDVQLNVVVDPDVLGGIRVELGDDVIDGTIVGRLDDARRKITG